MTVGALPEGQADKLERAITLLRDLGGEGPVTVGARDGRMATGERVVGLAVVEADDRRPDGHRMTIATTVDSELIFVLVTMARQTGLLAQTEIGSREVLALGPKLSRSLEQLGAMTGGTFESRMSPFEGVAGQAVIKGRKALVSPPDELEVPAVVLDVTALAAFIVRPGVETLSCVDTLAEDLVTGQAPVGRNTFAPLVTFQTLSAPFELSVWLAQISRRELCHQVAGAEK